MKSHTIEHKNLLKNSIIYELDGLPLVDCIEVIGNVLLSLGLDNMDSVPTSIAKEQAINIILSDRKTHGETLSNSVALQGATMLMWLDKK